MRMNIKKKVLCCCIALLMLALTGCQAMTYVDRAADFVVDLLTFGETEEPTPTPKPQVTVEYGTADPVTIDLLENEPLSYLDKGSYVWDGDRVTYTDSDAHVMLGIDVSEHQKYPDWDKVAEDGIEFAMLRLGYRGSTEGQLYIDPVFQYNLRKASEAGLDIGIYFFSQATSRAEAVAEAYFILGVLDYYSQYKEHITMPIVFDWEEQEFEGSRSMDPDGKTVTTCAKHFTEVIAEAGYTPGVYFNRHMGYYLYDLSRIDDSVECWFSGFGEYSDFYYEHSMWQYTFSGDVEGIEGSVDMNLYVKPIEEAAIATEATETAETEGTETTETTETEVTEEADKDTSADEDTKDEAAA